MYSPMQTEEIWKRKALGLAETQQLVTAAATPQRTCNLRANQIIVVVEAHQRDA